MANILRRHLKEGARANMPKAEAESLMKEVLATEDPVVAIMVLMAKELDKNLAKAIEIIERQRPRERKEEKREQGQWSASSVTRRDMWCRRAQRRIQEREIIRG